MWYLIEQLNEISFDGSLIVNNRLIMLINNKSEIVYYKC
mgnify:FL=1